MLSEVPKRMPKRSVAGKPRRSLVPTPGMKTGKETPSFLHQRPSMLHLLLAWPAVMAKP